MNISHLDIFKLKNIEPNIINLINDYKHSIEKYELDFFDNLPDYIDERYLNCYYNFDFKNLFNENISINDKLKILNQLDIEIYDIENNVAIEVLYTDDNYFFKWKLFKSDIYENNINALPIRHLKHFMLLSNKNINRKNNIFTFTLNELIKITNTFGICLHCVLKDYINNTTEKDNNFINKLKLKLV